MPTLFEKIANREIPAEIHYEDDLCLCFSDISPQAPTHLLLVPKKPIPRIAEATEDDQSTLGHMMLMVGKIAAEAGLAETGFRTVINNGQVRGRPPRICM